MQVKLWGVNVCIYSAIKVLRSGLQWNLSIEDTIGIQLAVLYTVEPLYRGHHWDPAGCPVYSRPLYRGHHWDPAGCPVYSGTSL